ncbi:transposase [Bacillus subtilis]|nr:transposase [Bacillus subtilis]MEC0326783.1 transposase [Bacillus subtilis]MEC0412532.1 transposase [Bacillus subtilis]MEC0420464.1 transposase [Bacillus subtilis]UWJ03691.1 transposase [Bacillus subtilis]
MSFKNVFSSTVTDQKLYPSRTFWSDGYFSCSIGNVSKEIIQKYIQEQGR